MASNEKDQPIGSAFDLLEKSFNIVKTNWQMFLLVNILTLLSALTAWLPEPSPELEENPFNVTVDGVGGLSGIDVGYFLAFGVIFIAIFLIVGIYFYVLEIILSTKAASGSKPTVGELMSEANKIIFKVILLSLASALIIIAGLILLIVPGIIAFGRLVMAPYIMVDKGLGVGDSLKESNRLSKKYSGKVWSAIGVMILITFGLSFLSIIPLIGAIVGAVLGIAFSLVIVLRYFQIKKLDETKATPELNPAAPPPTV